MPIVPTPGLSMHAMPLASVKSPYPAACAVESWWNGAVAARATAGSGGLASEVATGASAAIRLAVAASRRLVLRCLVLMQASQLPRALRHSGRMAHLRGGG